MKEGQEAIYFLTGSSREMVERSPHLEAFRDKGYEVLYLIDPVDEVWVERVAPFEEKKFQSVGKGEVELGSEEEKKKAEEERKEKEKSFKDLMGCLKSHLEEDIKEVRLSSRLTSSAVCLVGEAHDMSPQLEQMMRRMGQADAKVETDPGTQSFASIAAQAAIHIREGRCRAGVEGLCPPVAWPGAAGGRQSARGPGGFQQAGGRPDGEGYRVDGRPGVFRAFHNKMPSNRRFETTSGISLKVCYGPEDLSGFDPERDLGLPGEFPFARGIQPEMYRNRFWTMRQYAGFGSAGRIECPV